MHPSVALSLHLGRISEIAVNRHFTDRFVFGLAWVDNDCIRQEVLHVTNL